MGEHGRRLVAARDVAPDRRRGAELRVLLGPRTVGSTSGFLGVANLAPGERIAEHYHPYSEEFLYVCRGALVVDLDDEPVPVRAGEALFVPVKVRHRLRNVAAEPAEVVFHLGPLAPRPELGHVDTEAGVPPVLGPGPAAVGPAGASTGPRTGPGPAPTTASTAETTP
jgi:putative monooxygenase